MNTTIEIFKILEIITELYIYIGTLLGTNYYTILYIIILIIMSYKSKTKILN